MNLSAQEIEQIVVRVMEQMLTPAESARARLGDPTHHRSAELIVSESVITQELLAGTVNGATRIRIAPRAILTPSARDFLRSRGIDCIREAAVTKSKNDRRWQAVITKTTPQVEATIENARAEGVPFGTRVLGLPEEAARHAVSAICRGEAARVVAFTAEPELVACLANRNAAVRAVALGEPQALVNALRSVRPNLLTINPVGKSFYELRNVLRSYITLNLEP